MFGYIGMVYAMFSIGLLGFIVWSQKVALPYCEIGVRNLAVCWNSLVLIGTLYSKNPISYTQSAGNLYTKGLKSSSEIICETSRSFDLFNKVSKTQISNKWLSWFIGFSEGDGAILTCKNRARFVITQKEGNILFEIQNILGFGTVKLYNDYYRYIVTDPDNILLLFYIFNGNLVLSYRQNQLAKWVQTLNHNLNLSLALNIRLIEPSLSDSWLSGFTDAEGCFNVAIQPRNKTITGYRLVLRFLLDQKNGETTLIQIKNLFGYGQVNIRKNTNNVYRYNNSSFKGLFSVCNYFLLFPLKTKKRESFERWLHVLNFVLNKKHLNIEGLEKIRTLAKEININNSLTRKTGSSKPR